MKNEIKHIIPAVIHKSTASSPPSYKKGGDSPFTIRISDKLIDYHLENGTLKEFAVFLKLKGNFSNSCYFNYSHRSAGAKVNISKSRIHRYVNKFIKMGWVRFHSGNLVFNKSFATTDLKTGYSKMIFKIDTSGSIQDILDKLMQCKLKQAEVRFKFCEELWADKIKVSFKDVKRYKLACKKLRDDQKISISERPNFSISFGTIANKLNISKRTAWLFIKRLEAKGLIKLFKGKIEFYYHLSKIERKNILDNVKGYYSHKGNCLVIKYSNSYNF